MENDPEEIENLAENPKYADVVKEMRDQLEKEQYETGDVWLFRDGVSTITTLHAQQKYGLKLVDRLDFDHRRPGNAVGPHWVPPETESNPANMVEFG